MTSENSKVDPEKSEEEEHHVSEKNKSLMHEGGFSSSLPVSPVYGKSPENTRQTKSSAAVESDSGSIDISSLLDDTNLPPIIPIHKVTEAGTVSEAKTSSNEITSPRSKSASEMSEENKYSPTGTTGETRIDMSKDSEQAEPTVNIVPEKTVADNVTEPKLSTLPEQELEPIPEVEDTNGKSDKELWV